MASVEKSILDRIRSVIQVTWHGEPATEEMIRAAEQALGVELPHWLREIYLGCDGFSGPTNVHYLYPLEGPGGVRAFTLFLRSEWALPWLERAIIFSDNGVGTSCTVHWGALDGKLITWCYGDEGAFSYLDCNLFDEWRREQEKWDSLDNE